MIKTFIGFTILLLIYSCQNPSRNQAIVSGDLSDADGIKLILQEMNIGVIHSNDSVVLDKSEKFLFSPVITEPGFWMVKAPTGKILVLMLNPGDRIELSGSFRDFPDNVSIKGPEEAVYLNDFYRQTRLNEQAADSLEMILEACQDSSEYYQLTQQYESSFGKIWENQRRLEVSYIENHPGSLSSLVVLNYAFGLSPVLNPEKDFVYYRMLDSSLVKQFPGNKHVKFHHQRMEMQQKTRGIK